MESIKKLEQELNTKLAKTDWDGGEIETIRMHTNNLLAEAKRLYEFEYIDSQKYELLCYACEKHDYGKINVAMQTRMRKKNMKFRDNLEVQHNILSAFFVHNEDFKTEEDFLAVLYAVLYHHDNHQSSETLASILIRDRDSELMKQFLEQYAEIGAKKIKISYLKHIDELFKYTDYDKIPSDEKQLFHKMIVLKGLLHKCDYSASAHIHCEYKNDFLLEKLEKFRTFEWNELQKFMLKHSKDNVIVTAPTGSGKTEAGLLWAGNHKCFFVLPLRTAINAIYDRIKNDILCKTDRVEEQVALLHSDMQSYYLDDFNEENSDFSEDMLTTYVIRSKQMSLPITVVTLDQIFDFTLKFYGYEYKLSTLAYSKIIIDEIQMYSPDLLAYLMYGIKKIVEFGGHIAVLTATLPPFVKDELVKILGDTVRIDDFSRLGKIRHNVQILERQMKSEEILHIWKSLEGKKSRKFLVICNCVETAQRLYKEIKQGLQQENVEIHLLHSHFTKEDRAEKEAKLLKVGKTYKENGTIDCSHQIWISTSVVEASLDIDFDYLVTELLELFSLFQRMGRVNRKGEKEISESNCYVYTELQDGPLRKFGKDKEGYKFVDDDMYLLSKEALISIMPGGIIDEGKKSELIQTYLSTKRLERTNYIMKYKTMFHELENLYIYEKNKCPIRDIENIDIIPYGVYCENQEVIEEAEQKLKGGELSVSERLMAVETIRKYTVSVNMYKIREVGKREKQTKIEKKVALNRHTKVPVVHCEYTNEFGLEKILYYEKITTNERMI